MTTETSAAANSLHDFILAHLPSGVSLTPQEIARAYWETRRKASDPPDGWRRYMVAVRQTALSMARQEKLVFLRKGVPADPRKVKGVIRLRRREPGEDITFAHSERAPDDLGDGLLDDADFGDF